MKEAMCLAAEGRVLGSDHSSYKAPINTWMSLGFWGKENIAVLQIQHFFVFTIDANLKSVTPLCLNTFNFVMTLLLMLSVLFTPVVQFLLSQTVE